MKFKYCLGLTLFNATDNDIKRIVEYKKIFEKIYIYDNSLKKNSFQNNVKYYHNSKNEGISIAFNQMAKDAFLDGFDYMLFMDQDSEFSKLNIEKIITSIENSKETIDLIGPKIIYDKDSHIQKYENKLFEVEWIITSGSFNRLEKYLSVGGYDESYFIDRIDRDYCKTLQNKNSIILMHNDSLLYQSLGDKTHYILNQIYSEHSELRNYYISRNRLYYSRKFNEKKIKVFFSFVKQVILIIIFDEKKIKKLKSILDGIKDFKKEKFGVRELKGDNE